MTLKIEDLKTPLDRALFHLELGHSVFPLQNPDHSISDKYIEIEKKTGEVRERKEPDIPSLDPPKQARATEVQIRKWWEEEPNRNVGVMCGKVSGNLIVIDVDGDGSGARMEEKIFKNLNSSVRIALINTMVVTTGSGGKHYYLILNDPIMETLGSSKIWSNGEDHEEISILGNNHYVSGIGNRHPNGKYYVWNEKKPLPISIKEFKELITAVAANPEHVLSTYLRGVGGSASTSSTPTLSASPSSESTTSKTTTIPFTINNTTASEETLTEIYETIKPYYKDGDRDLIHHHLTACMRKDGDFSLQDCETVSTKLCENSDYRDEDLSKSLDTVRRNFTKQLDILKGRAGLYEVLISSKDGSVLGTDAIMARIKAHGKLLEIIFKNKNKNKEETLVDGCIVMEPMHPESKTYMTAFSTDNFWDKVTESNRVIRAIRTIHREWDESKNVFVDKYGDIIINAVPVPPIVRIYDPLFNIEKYEMLFEYVGSNNTIKQKKIGPLTKEELVNYLKNETTFVYKEKYVANALNQIISGYERKNMLVERKETETEGLIWDQTENKLILSQRVLYKPTPEECRQCIKVITELQAKFYQDSASTSMERKRFAHFIKVGIAAPTSFARRQMGVVGDSNWIPIQDLAGFSRAGKSYGYAGLALRMYRLPMHGSSKYDIGAGSVETGSRFIAYTKGTTFPVILEDVDWLSDPQNKKTTETMPLIKNQVSMTNPRDTQTTDNKRRSLPSCAYIMITHNSKLIDEDGFIRRATGHEFTKDDFKPIQRRTEYEKFFDGNGHTFGYLGDFALWYYLNHPDVLKDDWVTMTKTVLQAFYEYAGYRNDEEIPQWLLNDVVKSASSQEALAEHNTTAIIDTLYDVILVQCWSRNKREILFYIEKEIKNTLDEAVNPFYQNIDKLANQATMKNKLEAIAKMGLIPYVKWHHEFEICIGSGFIEELKKRQNRISLTQIPSFCNSLKYDPSVRFAKEEDKSKHRMLKIKLDELVELLSLTTTAQGTLLDEY
jgi:hypothetical protein